MPHDALKDLFAEVEKEFPDDRSAKTIVGISLSHEIVLRSSVPNEMKMDAILLLIEYTHRELLTIALQDIMKEVKKNRIPSRVLPLSMCEDSLQWIDKRQSHMRRMKNIIEYMVEHTSNHSEEDTQ